MDDYCERILDDSNEVSDQAFRSLEASVLKQMSHIALSFDEFIHLQSRERVRMIKVFRGVRIEVCNSSAYFHFNFILSNLLCIFFYILLLFTYQVHLLTENSDALAKLCILNLIYKYIVNYHCKISKIMKLFCVYKSKCRKNAEVSKKGHLIVPTTQRILLKVNQMYE